MKKSSQLNGPVLWVNPFRARKPYPTNTLLAGVVLALISIGASSPIPVQGDDDPAAVERQLAMIETAELARQGKHEQVYFITEGDTFKSIAAQYSDDPSFAAELQALNQITEEAFRPGRPLVIPGPERDAAIRALEIAKAEMRQAVTANAAKYAMADFKDAVNIYDDGSNARNKGSYIRARLLAELAAQRFRTSREKADRGALVDRESIITPLNGKTYTSTNNGLSFKSIAEETSVAPGTIIRTDESGSARIVFRDHSSLLVKPGSSLAIARYRQDQRSGRSQRVVQLQSGEVLAEIKPLPSEDSEFILVNQQARIDLDNATVLAFIDNKDRMIQCTYKGTAQLSFQGMGVEQATGFGSICTPRNGLVGPVPLNEAVDLISPPTSGLVSASQRFPFVWREAANHKSIRYHLEVARDADFADVVAYKATKETSFTPEPLPAGSYFIRVGLEDERGLPGFYSEVATLVIKPDLDLSLGYDLKQLKLGDDLYVAPNARIIAVPVSTDNSIKEILYQIDDGAFFASEDGVALAEQGTYQVTAQSKGVDGELGQPVSQTWRIDHTPPDLRIHVGELTEIPGYGTVRTVAFIADDNTKLSTVEYSLNGDEYKAYTTPLKLPVSKNFRIEARALDHFDNQSLTVLSLERITPSAKKRAATSSRDESKGGLLDRIFRK